jgi:hypothetical protein
MPGSRHPGKRRTRLLELPVSVGVGERRYCPGGGEIEFGAPEGLLDVANRPPQRRGQRPASHAKAERVFEPLGMVDTGFVVPPAKRDRFTSYYRSSQAGVLELADGPDR